MSKPYDKPLSAKELTKRPEGEVDYSDIPELDEAFWANAKIRVPQTKPNISLRVSPMVVEYFKRESPKGFTTHMAAVLEAYVALHQTK